MKVTKAENRTTIELEGREHELLCLALKRASFEDIPVNSLEHVLDLTVALLGELES